MAITLSASLQFFSRGMPVTDGFTGAARQRRVAAVSLLFAFMLAIIYMASRAGLPGNAEAWHAVVSALALTMAALAAPVLARTVMPLRALPAGLVLALGISVTLSLLVLLSWLPGGGWILAALAVAASVFLAPALLGPAVPVRSWLWLGLLAGLAVLLASYAMPRSQPPFSAEQALSQHLFIDGYFHMAMAQMMRWFGVPATGIDGLSWANYHYGLHVVVARLAVLVDGDIPQFFPAFMHLTVLPLLVAALVAVASDRTEHDALPLTVFIVALVVLYASITNDVIFISASYMASILLAVGTYGLIVWVAGHPRSHDGRDAPLWVWKLLLALLFANWAFKVTTGMLLTVAFGWLVLRSGRRFSRVILAGLAVLLVSVLAIWRFVSFGDHASVMSVSPFKYYWADEVKVWHRPFFMLIYSAFPIIFCVARMVEEKASSGWWPAFRSGRLVDVEAVLLMTVIAYVPGAIFHTGDLVWIYLYDFAAWLTLPLVAGAILAARWVDGGRPVAGLSGAVLVALVLAAPTLEAIGGVMMKRTGRFFAEVVETHRGLLGASLPTRGDLSNRGDAAYAALGDLAGTWSMIRQPKGEPAWAARVLALARQLRAQHGPNVALYVPPTNLEFWAEDQHDCRITAMFVPALAGIPLIDGRPPLPCVPAYGYGFELVQRRTDNRPMDDAEVCASAVRWAIPTVLRVETLKDGARNRVLDCSKGGAR